MNAEGEGRRVFEIKVDPARPVEAIGLASLKGCARARVNDDKLKRFGNDNIVPDITG